MLQTLTLLSSNRMATVDLCNQGNTNEGVGIQRGTYNGSLP